MRYVQYAQCVLCGRRAPAVPDSTVCPSCGIGVLDIVYDYAAISASINHETFRRRKDTTMWRYLEFLPVEERPASGLAAGGSPLYRAKKLGAFLGLYNLWLKDDGVNPTGSLKDRASAMAVVKALEAGADTIACSSTGNAASSLAGSAAAAGLNTYIFVPARAPQAKVTQLLIFGAHVIRVRGSYEDTFRISAEAIKRWGWYNRNAAINPFLSEGKKTVAFEIAEQLDWRVPDYVAVSVGDGCTIAGIWKGFQDLYAAKLTDRLPRLVSVQASGCCPINSAVESGAPILAEEEENTIADSIAVGVPRNFSKAYKAIQESKGITVNVTDEEILEAMSYIGRTSGVFGEPAGAAATAGLKKAAAQGRIPPDALVVTIVTGSGLKDIAGAQKAAGAPTEIDPTMDSLLKALEVQ